MKCHLLSLSKGLNRVGVGGSIGAASPQGWAHCLGGRVGRGEMVDCTQANEA